jgi:phage tail-like protein
MADKPGQYIDPYRAYNFKLLVDQVAQGHFTECQGLSIKVDAIAYREGGNSQVVRYLPGRVTYSEVTLAYGVTGTADLWKWFMSAVKGKVDRRSVSIVMLDNDGQTELVRWNLIRAWPCSWHGAPLDALGKEAAIEKLVLRFEELERDPDEKAA